MEKMFKVSESDAGFLALLLEQEARDCRAVLKDGNPTGAFRELLKDRALRCERLSQAFGVGGEAPTRAVAPYPLKRGCLQCGQPWGNGVYCDACKGVTT